MIEVFDPEPVSEEIWKALVPEGLKLHSLAKVNGRIDPYKHIASINMQIAILVVP